MIVVKEFFRKIKNKFMRKRLKKLLEIKIKIIFIIRNIHLNLFERFLKLHKMLRIYPQCLKIKSNLFIFKLLN